MQGPKKSTSVFQRRQFCIHVFTESTHPMKEELIAHKYNLEETLQVSSSRFSCLSQLGENDGSAGKWIRKNSAPPASMAITLSRSPIKN